MTRQSQRELEQYLIERGWIQRGVYPWEWVQATLPAAHYVLDDAVSLQKALDKQKNAASNGKRKS